MRKLRNREQDLENQINELKESYEKLSGENGDLRERYDNLYLELESRPTVHAWHEAQSQLQSLELEIQSAVEFGLNRERLQVSFVILHLFCTKSNPSPFDCSNEL